MTDLPKNPAVPPPVAKELERRLNWGALPAILFLVMLASLASIAIYSTVARPRTAIGLPADPDVAAARTLLEGRMRSPVQELRFTSALSGESAPDAPPTGHDRLAAARERLERAVERLPLDPRALTALGHVELALRRGPAAESHYRLALEFTPHYGEARLGLGLALAQRSYQPANVLERRRLQLRALAQFTAVRDDDPVAACALYNRAVMAHMAGRDADARSLEERYRSLDPGGPWARRLERMLGRNE